MSGESAGAGCVCVIEENGAYGVAGAGYGMGFCLLKLQEKSDLG